MKKTMKRMAAMLMAVAVAGCATGGGVDPVAETSEKFRVDRVDVSVRQKVTPDIVYHTESEIQEMLRDGIVSLLKEKGRLTDSESANGLEISVVYERRFVGDETPFPTDSLAYPEYEYEIKVLDGVREVVTVKREDGKLGGGIAMNLKVMSGRLRKKSDEVVFIDKISEGIVEEIGRL